MRNLAARMAMRGKSGATARDYIQTTFMMFYDAIENGGYGTHAAQGIADLSGNYDDIATSSSFSIGDRYIDFPYGDSSSYAETQAVPIASGSPFTMEAVIARLFSGAEVAGQNEVAIMKSDPWLGINLKSGDTVRFSNTANDIDISGTFTTDRFNSYAMTRDDNGDFSYYINGERNDASSNTTRAYDNAFIIGVWTRLAPLAQLRFGSFRLSGACLSQPQISFNYQIDKKRFPLT